MPRLRRLVEAAALAFCAGPRRVGDWVRSVVLGRHEDRPVGLRPATRDRVIDLIQGDLDCLIDDAKEKDVSVRAAEEMLRNQELLVWLRGGPLPGQGAVELLEDNVTVFYREPAAVEQANGDALRVALDALVRAQETSGAPDGGSVLSAGLTERQRRCLGRHLDSLRHARNMTIGDLAARSGVEVVRLVALVYGADEAGAIEMMELAAALEVEPRELFPEFLVEDDDVGHDSQGGSMAGPEGVDG